eukprot:1195218-Prorocentrum_minimum.AAC.3
MGGSAGGVLRVRRVPRRRLRHPLEGDPGGALLTQTDHAGTMGAYSQLAADSPQVSRPTREANPRSYGGDLDPVAGLPPTITAQIETQAETQSRTYGDTVVVALGADEDAVGSADGDAVGSADAARNAFHFGEQSVQLSDQKPCADGEAMP